ncbi:MAG: ATP-binding cassette domain-containing protein [Promethearchaeota archaeon]
MTSEVSTLQIIDLTKIYPHPLNPQVKTPVLVGVSFELDSSELMYLLGPSGSGKSTLLNILSGTLDFDAGEVRLNEKSLHLLNFKERRKYLQDVKKVVQIPRLNIDFNLSLKDNLRLPLILAGSFPREEQKKCVNVLLKRIQLEELIKTPLRSLSGGELQRLAIGIAIIVPPKLLLLDEPTSQLDHTNTLIIQELVNELLLEYDTLCIFATHDEYLLTKSHGRVLRLERGKIMEE